MTGTMAALKGVAAVAVLADTQTRARPNAPADEVMVSRAAAVAAPLVVVGFGWCVFFFLRFDFCVLCFFLSLSLGLRNCVNIT